MLEPPPNGITTASFSTAAATTASHLVLGAGAHHDVGRPTQIPPALADQVRKALPARMHHAVAIVGGDVLAANGARQLSPQAVRERGHWDLQILEADGARAAPADVKAEHSLDEGRQLGLALVGE